MPTGGVNGEVVIDIGDTGLARGDMAPDAESQDGEHADVALDNLTVSARCTPAHFARQCDKWLGDRDGVAYRGTAGADTVRTGRPSPSELGVLTRRAISGPSS